MLNNFVNFYHNLDKKSKVIFWVVFVDLIIIIALAVIFFIYRLNNEPRNITITNWDEYASEVPDDFHKAVLESITSVLTNYNNVSIENHYNATIRNDSYMATNSQKNSDITNVSFLVDIEELQQSYQIEFSYNKDNRQNRSSYVSVSCPIFTYIIYPDSKCRTSESPYSVLDLHYLPYDGYLPQSNAKFTIKKQIYGTNGAHPKSPYLAVSVNSCDNTTIIQEAKEYIPVWLKERYLNPNDFYYEVFNTCEV